MKLLCTLFLFAAAMNGQRSRGDRTYEEGTRALDRGKWEDAAQLFAQEASSKGQHADAALYWKAYAESKLGRRDAAVSDLAALRRDYASSRWINDAQALEVEVKQQSGSPVNPNAEGTDDLKMLALNGLLHSDPEQAIPIIDKILRQSTSRQLKERALFVLTQSRSPKAMQILRDAANGAYNPDVQVKAIHMYGIGQGNSDDLVKIYNSAKEREVKREVVNALFIQHNAKAMIELARKEQDPSLKKDVVEKLSLIHSPETTSYFMEILNK